MKAKEAAYGQRYQVKERRRITARRVGQSRQRLGVSPEMYAAMLAAQQGLCAICKQPNSASNRLDGEPKALAVDHNHKTGEIRKLLCDPCNRALGLFQDSVSILERAVEYLKEHEA